MFKGLGKGAIALVLSGFVCKFFGALFRLPLTSILGIEGIGVFQMVMSLYSLALVFVTGGVTNSLAKLISSARARGQVGKISNYFKLSVMLSLSAAFLIGFAFFLLSKNISHVQGVAEGELSYKLFLILIPIGALIGVLRGVIQGFENMVPTAISQILEQVFKLALGLVFAYFLGKRGTASGVFGGFLGITLSEVIAFVYLGIFALRHIKFVGEEKGNFPVLISAVAPLTFASAIIPLTHAFDGMVIVSLLQKAGLSKGLATSLFGLQTGVVGAILNIPLIFSLSLAMTLLPKISYLDTQNNVDAQKAAITNSFVAMWAVVLPLVFGIVAIGGNLFQVIYPKTITPLLEQSIQLTMLGAVAIILTAIMQFLTSILQARGNFVFTFVATLFGGLTKILLVYFLASKQSINIFALPISNIALAVVICVFCLLKLGDLVQISAFDVFTPLFSSIIMFAVVRLFTRASISNFWIVILATFVGAIVYFVFAFPVLRNLFSTFFGRRTDK